MPAHQVAASEAVRVGDWLLDPGWVAKHQDRLVDVVSAHRSSYPLEPGMALAAVAQKLGLPEPELVTALVRPPFVVTAGRVVDPRAALPSAVVAAVREVAAELADNPFGAPEAGRLSELGLDPRALGGAARAGLLLRLADQGVLLPGADTAALALLREVTGIARDA